MKKSLLLGIFLIFIFYGMASAVTISGYVRTSLGTGVGGVTVTFSNKAGAVITAKTGYYSKTVATGWAGTVTPSKTGYYFSPAHRLYTKLFINQKNQNFTRYVQTYTLSGSIKNASGTGIEGVTVTFSNGEGTATTGSDGSYSTTVAYNWSGTATPSIGSHTFSPASITYTNVLSHKTSEDYTGTILRYYISGYVKDGAGDGVSGVAVTLNNGGGSATTSSSGYYYRYVDYGWSGMATPSSSAYSFSPSELSYTNVTTNYTGKNYTGTLNTYAISGYVKTVGGIAISSSVTFSNGGGTTTTSKTGYYSKSVNHGWSGTVTPTAAAYTFSPTSRKYTSIRSAKSTQNFAGTRKTYAISGYVTTPTGQGMDGATVTFSNSGGTVTTSSTGYYTSSVTYGWTGTATVAKTGFTFSPTSRSYTSVTATFSNQDFSSAYITYTLSGYIKNGLGRALAGVTVGFTNSGVTTTTTKAGYYSKVMNHGWSGSVVPVRAGYTFSPSSRAYTKLARSYSSQDFTWAHVYYTVSGTIVDTVGLPLPGVTVTLGNGGGVDVTDENGYYAEAVSYGWSGTATPSCSSHVFDPVSRSYSNVTSHKSVEQYTGTINSYSIRGEIREAFILNGNVLPGDDINNVWVHFAELGSVFTSTWTGSFWFLNNSYVKNVPHGWSGWVWPTKQGYEFYSDDSLWCENVTAPDTLNFYGGVIRYAISGTLRSAAGNPIEGAWLKANNDEGASGKTDEDGVYHTYVDYGWSGALKVDAPFCTADKESIMYSEVYGAINGQNYTGEYVWCTVSGQVYTGSFLKKLPLSGVEIAINAPSDFPGDTTVYSNKFGNYSARVIQGVSNNFWPQKQGYKFTPSMYYPATDSVIDVHALRYGTIMVSGYTMIGDTAIFGTQLDFWKDYVSQSDSTGYFEQQLFLTQEDSAGAYYYNGGLELRHDEYVFLPPDSSLVRIYTDSLLGTFQARLKYQFQIVASAGIGGSITPEGLTYVKEMTNQSFSIVPDSGYVIADVVISDTSYGAIPEFLFDNVESNQTITASFEPVDTLYNVSIHCYRLSNDSLVTVDSTIIPQNDFVVNKGSNARISIFPPYFTYTPVVYINGLKDTSNTYRIATSRYEALLENITEDQTVWIVYMPPMQINSGALTLFSLPGGTVNPTGMRYFIKGSDLSVAILPDPGYHILDVMIDYSYIGAVDSYTFDSLTGPHTLVAAFDINSYPIISSATPGGTISPTGIHLYEYGDTATYSMSAEIGYQCDSVIVDSVNIGAPSQYAFTEVADSHSIVAHYAPQPHMLITRAGEGGAVSPAGTTMVTYFDTTIVTLIPDAGYEIATVLIDDSVVTTNTTYVFTQAHQKQTLQVNFVLKKYRIIADATIGGSISPDDTIMVTHGNEQVFNITPTTGYEVAEIVVDSSAVGADTIYTFDSVTDNHILQAQFTLQEFTISTTVGSGGSLTPLGENTSLYGDTLQVIVISDAGYQVAEMLVDGVSVGAATEYTFEYITHDHTLEVTFRRLEYTATASMGMGGSISPVGDSTILHGDSMVYAITPLTGYFIEEIVINSVVYDADETVTLLNITEDVTIHATFTLKSYAMVAMLGAGGTIDPAGSTVVYHGDHLAYTITPHTGYQITDVVVDDVSQGVVTLYTFTDINTAHTLAASFALQTFTLTAAAGAGGTISSLGDTVLAYGEALTYTVSIEEGYQLDDVLVDGISQGDITSYTFESISAGHTICAVFKKRTYPVYALVGVGGSCTLAGTTAVQHGDSLSFTIVPTTGYVRNDVLIDSISQGAQNSVVMHAITAPHTVTVTFALKTFMLITTADGGGSTSPAGTTVVQYGDTTTVTMLPATGYTVADITVDSTYSGALTQYTFNAITKSHTLSARFMLQTYMITATAGTGGSVAPAGETAATYGDTLGIGITPDAGYALADVLIDGVSQGVLDSVVLQTIDADHTVHALFALKKYMIVTTNGTGGSVTPAGTTVVSHGDSLHLSMAPATGYEVAAVALDGTGLGAVTSYLFTNITAAHTVATSFALQRFTVTATAGEGGAITPAGDTEVTYDATAVMVVTPAAGYVIAAVVVDGVSQGVMDTIRLEGVRKDYTVSASFTLKTFTVITTSSTGGGVAPAGTSVVAYGDSLGVTVTSQTGYRISNIVVDGIGLGSFDTYVFKNITAPHTLHAEQVLQTFTVTASSGIGGSIVPFGDTVVTYGDSLVLAPRADEGYELFDILIDSVSYGELDTIRLEIIVADHEVHTLFSLKKYTLTTSAGVGGSVSPLGSVQREHGEDVTVHIVADTGYAVKDVLIDGVSVGAVTAYTFAALDTGHTVSASFLVRTVTHMLVATTEMGGTISPAGTTGVNQGNNITFTMSPDDIYWTLADVFVDEVSVGAVTAYSFVNVTAPHSIRVSFMSSGIPHSFPLYTSAESGGTVAPAGTLVVAYGADTVVHIQAATGYTIADVRVDDSSYGAVEHYTFQAVTDTHQLIATFNQLSYTIIAQSGNHGEVSPAGTTAVVYGATQSVVITPHTGYAVSEVYVDGISQGAITHYTFNDIIAHHTLSALFAPVEYLLSATAGTGGTITPQGAVQSTHGSMVTFTITADTGYSITDVLVDSVSVGAVAEYAFVDVATNHTIDAIFGVQTFAVVTSAGSHGIVSPLSTSLVAYEDMLLVEITPDSGYAVDDVFIDGVSVGAVATYTFDRVIRTHTLSALFVASNYSITAHASVGGSISPEGEVAVAHGANRLFTITPATGYSIADVLVDDVSVGAVATYTFNAVTESHTIMASFALRTWEVVASAGEGGVVSPAGTTLVTHGDSATITITPSLGYRIDAVYTNGSTQGAVREYTFQEIADDQVLTAVFTKQRYPMVMTTQGGGSTTPAGTSWVAYEESLVVALNAATGFMVDIVIVDGDTLSRRDTYRFASVTTGHTLHVVYTEIFFLVTATHIGSGGTLAPLGDISVPYGTSLSFTLTPDTGYHTSTMVIDGVSMGVLDTYTFTHITANHTISAEFDRTTYAVNASAGAGGTIDPLGVQNIFYGDTLVFMVQPNEGYACTYVTVDGVVQSMRDTVVLTAIDTAHTIYASFERIAHQVIAMVMGVGGTIAPAGSVAVFEGSEQQFSFTAAIGYEIEDVLLDDISQGAVTTLILDNVATDHTITVSFKKEQYLLQAFAGSNGTISPAGSLYYAYGVSAPFTIIPDSGFIIENVFVDGMRVGNDTAYTFIDIREPHTITALFVSATIGIHLPLSLRGIQTVHIYPNPSRGNTEIAFELQYAQVVRVVVLDRTGTEVWEVPAQRYAAGVVHYTWRSDLPGVYLVRLEGAHGAHTIKVLVMP